MRIEWAASWLVPLLVTQNDLLQIQLRIIANAVTN